MAEIVFDSFHLQREVFDAVDKVRRSIVRELTTNPEEAGARAWPTQDQPIPVQPN